MTCLHQRAGTGCDVCSDADRPWHFGIDLAPATRVGTCYGPCGDPVHVGDMVLAGDGETPLIHADCYARLHEEGT